eukprot:CAMPEP_0174869888 /NCGR_PEP_ID=MMETSP1114-20130205/68694_1 /TAXON_ID=312471 /ORGANISM="Neobodo designis, Strain CCAP 1951/1" /LENGTH=59 /DNA_ID=CAMNT_0016105149 /DNA_START=42 /DNA_END=217 /DNA_ORIENTATION=+
MGIVVPTWLNPRAAMTGVAKEVAEASTSASSRWAYTAVRSDGGMLNQMMLAISFGSASA